MAGQRRGTALCNTGIYRAIAIALRAEPLREAALVYLITQIGNENAAARARG